MQSRHANILSFVFRIFLLSIFLFTITKPTIALADYQILVQGRVTDSLTGDPIPDAYMEIKDASNNTLANVSTDANGYYEISAEFDAASMVYATANFKDTGDYFCSGHIVEGIDISQYKERKMTIDFSLQPAGVAVLQVFDQSGNRVKNSEVLSIINNNAFITNLSDLPISGIYSTVEENEFRKDETIAELASPAFYIPIQTPVVLHVLWDIPDFGRIIVDLDNGGDGYLFEKTWEVKALNFNYEAARSEVLRLARELSQYQNEGYTFSFTVESELAAAQTALNSGETHFNADLPEMALAVADFNEALVTALRGQETLYLEKAAADIPKFREGSIHLTIRNADGTPASNSAVTYRQISHDFKFGGSYLTDGWNYLPQIGDQLADAGFNKSAVMMLHCIVEPEPGEYDFSYADHTSGLEILLEKGFRIDGELAYWNHGYGFDSPEYWKTMTVEEYQQNIYNHFQALGSHFGNRISLWLLNEQNLSWSNCTGLSWEEKLSTYQKVMDGLYAGYPDAKNIVSSIAMPYGWNQEILEDTKTRPAKGISFPVYLDMVLERGLPLDTIGLEFYQFGTDIPGTTVAPGLSLAAIARTMDLYNKYKLPVNIVEFQVPSSQEPGTSWLHHPWDEATQAEFTRDFYTLAFGTEYMQGVQWSAFVSDKNSFLINAGIFDEEYQPKPVYYTLKDLISAWTTTGSVVTDENGALEIRGFAGDYEITVAHPDGTQTQSVVHITEQQNSESEITVAPPDQEQTATKGQSIVICIGLGVLGIIVFLVLRKWKKESGHVNKG